MERIENFEELIKDYIGPGKSVLDKEITNLTAPGENYMSEILKIHVILKNTNTGVNEDLHLVAKLVTNDDFMGSTSHLTKNEIIFYKDIIPSIKSFHERHGLPYPTFFPDFVGGRINLTGGDTPDNTAVILLENLIEKGYENLDRHVGFDLETAKLVLDDLATFHSVPLAMKLLEPEIFETQIKAKCSAMQLGPPKKEDIKNGPKKGEHDSPHGPPDGPPVFFHLLLELLKQDEEYSQAIPSYENFKKKIEHTMKTNPEAFFNKTPVEPFATLGHSDMWINNTMQLLKDGVPIKNKIVDFQMGKICSPTLDLIFFLFSSVQTSCLRDDLDTLIKHYYQTFTNTLKKLNCYGPQFSYDNFLEEIKISAEGAIGQTIFMVPGVIFGEKGQVFDHRKSQTMALDEIPPLAREKLILLCLEASKRGWF